MYEKVKSSFRLVALFQVSIKLHLPFVESEALMSRMLDCWKKQKYDPKDYSNAINEAFIYYKSLHDLW